MPWFLRSKENISETQQKEMPDGLWTKCPSCSEMIFKKELEENYFCCIKCNYHYRIGTKEYVDIILDSNTFNETNTNILSSDPLNFVDSKPYKDRLKVTYDSLGINEALTTGTGKINGEMVSFASMNFSFIGGSMGSVVGEKFYRAAKLAMDKKYPLIVITSSGGARMQEAAYSLMQMAKTSAVLSELAESGGIYITILTDPTTGGVTASYGMLGDIILAEPGALIGFAGPRVIEQTIKRKLPPGFQRAEFLLEKGFVDLIVPRNELKSTLTKVIKWFKS
ncbi:MAG: acetyl-CoA carboxylase, carboxyltransferase subunit beta [Candidatus Kapabacteria bacterium]|nr:acetyl-CoA carboxylase, carboxyltransferase subunit beta [Candidatus Kapabacteria bacterium]